MAAPRSAQPVLRPGEELLAAINSVRKSGARVWAVGGTVRDSLLDLPRGDWDLATDAPPEEMARAVSVPTRVQSELGAVAARFDGCETVWTTLREETDYGTDRRPRKVRFVSEVERDAVRRDFTINAMYVELPEGSLIDPLGGVCDLEARRLRAIGEPLSRLREDPLRVLRGIRFAAGFNLVLEARTRLGMRAAAPGCGALSADRIREEVARALRAPGRGRAALLLAQLGVVEHALPEFASRSATEWLRVARLLEEIPDGGPAAIWAAVAGQREVAEALLGRLGVPRQHRRACHALIDLGAALRRWGELGPTERRDLIRKSWHAASPGFLRAVAAVEELPESRIEIMEREHRRLLAAARSPLVDGTDVLAAGVPPGPDVARILVSVRRGIERGSVRTRDAALALVHRLAADAVKIEGAERR